MSISEKFLRAPGPIEISGRTLKRYHITTFEAEIEPGIQKAARDILPELVPQSDDETPPAGWLVLHTGANGAYLWLTAGSGATSSRCGRRSPENPTLAALIPIPSISACSTAGGSAASGSWRRSATSDRPGCGTFSSQTCLT